MPIPEVVSGSFNAAATVRDIVLAGDQHRQIYLVNSRGAGAKLDLIFILFDRYLKNNPHVSFEEACAYFEQLKEHSKLLLRRNERHDRRFWLGTGRRIAGLSLLINIALRQGAIGAYVAGQYKKISTLHKIYYRTYPRKKAYALVAAMAPSETAVTT